MDHRLPVSRRKFVSLLGVAAASTFGASTAPRDRFDIIGFIKPFQRLSFEQIADTAVEAGWTGIECPLRKGGAIEPVRVEEDLPKLLEALRQRGLSLPVISTDVDDASDPLAQRVLKTASKLGIKRYRLKHYYYDLDRPIPAQLQNFRAKVRELAQLNQELNLQGSIQNHSGRNYVGAAGWDIWELLRDVDAKWMGVFFDIGHATIEGGYSWPSQAKLLAPWFSIISVKDFTWQKAEAGWRAEWCPLGEGAVRRDFFSFLKKLEFNGPITQQFEYKMGQGKEMTAAMRKDMAVLKNWLA